MLVVLGAVLGSDLLRVLLVFAVDALLGLALVGDDLPSRSVGVCVPGAPPLTIAAEIVPMLSNPSDIV